MEEAGCRETKQLWLQLTTRILNVRGSVVQGSMTFLEPESSPQLVSLISHDCFHLGAPLQLTIEFSPTTLSGETINLSHGEISLLSRDAVIPHHRDVNGIYHSRRKPRQVNEDRTPLTANCREGIGHLHMTGSDHQQASCHRQE